MTADQLESMSLVLVYSALAVYALSFVAFVMDLSARVEERASRADLVHSAAVSAPDQVRASREEVPTPGGEQPLAKRRLGRAAGALAAVAWVIHGGGVVLRGLADGHVPWSNLYEFALVGTFVMVAVFLGVGLRRDIRFAGSFVTGLATLLLGAATVNFYVPVTDLAVPLQSPWLVVHVAVALLATGFFSLGAGVSIAQITSAREVGEARPHVLARHLPPAAELERLASRLITIGFVFWTFTLIAGAVWAERAWGRYWGWDTKEVWTFVIWTLYAGFLHARATRGWRGTRAAWLAIIAFAAVLFNFAVVNVFFAGWHAYSGL